jgi:rod shape-determining protein MreB
MIPLPWRKPARPTIALDLGSVSTRVVAAERGLVADLPSVVALQDGNDGRRAVAVGGKAHELLGRGVPGLRVVQPIRGGLIEDYEASEHLLRHALEQGGGAAPRILVAVPFDATETERRALQSAARAAGAAEVEVVAAPLAAAIGAQLHVREPVGAMVVLVGGGRTEIAVVSLGGIVVRRSLRVAGEAMDAHLVAWLRRRHHVMVGAPTAERVKLDVGAARPTERPTQTRIRGRDLSTGAPVVLDVSSNDVADAVREPVERIRDAVLDALRETPPELCADVLASGVILVGGGARLAGLDLVLRDATGLPILHAEHPEHAVAHGLARLLDDAGLHEDVVAAAG